MTSKTSRLDSLKTNTSKDEGNAADVVGLFRGGATEEKPKKATPSRPTRRRKKRRQGNPFALTFKMV